MKIYKRRFPTSRSSDKKPGKVEGGWGTDSSSIQRGNIRDYNGGITSRVALKPDGTCVCVFFVAGADHEAFKR